jgi:hypothetical protein
VVQEQCRRGKIGEVREGKKNKNKRGPREGRGRRRLKKSTSNTFRLPSSEFSH